MGTEQAVLLSGLSSHNVETRRGDWSKKMVETWNALSTQYLEVKKRNQETMVCPCLPLTFNTSQCFTVIHLDLPNEHLLHMARDLGGKCPIRSRQKLLVLGLDGIVYVHVFLMIFQVSPSFHTWAIFPGLLAEQESLPTYAEANAEGTGHLKAEAVPNGGASCRS